MVDDGTCGLVKVGEVGEGVDDGRSEFGECGRKWVVLVMVHERLVNRGAWIIIGDGTCRLVRICKYG